MHHTPSPAGELSYESDAAERLRSELRAQQAEAHRLRNELDAAKLQHLRLQQEAEAAAAATEAARQQLAAQHREEGELQVVPQAAVCLQTRFSGKTRAGLSAHPLSPAA